MLHADRVFPPFLSTINLRVTTLKSIFWKIQSNVLFNQWIIFWYLIIYLFVKLYQLIWSIYVTTKWQVEVGTGFLDDSWESTSQRKTFVLRLSRRGTRCVLIGNEVQSPSVARERARTRNNDERVAQGNDRWIPSQDVSRFRNSFAGRNKFLKDPTSARSATAGRKIPAVTLRDLDVVEDPRLHILEIRSRRKACGLNY